MATVRISDIIVPEVFAGYMSKDTTEKTALFRSGILRSDGEIAAKIAGGGRTFNNPFWNDLDNTEAGTASDDPSQNAVPGTITASKDIVRRQVRTRGWSTADLSGILAGADPMARIRERVTAYWDRQFQRTLVATLKGVAASNVSNNSSDMISDISNDSSATATAAELISAEAIIDATYTMGDNADVLKVMVAHSTVVKRLKKLNLIDMIPDSEGRIAFQYYLGKLLIEDDNVTTVVGSNRTKYYTYLIGPGALSWAESSAGINPVAVQRYESQGNGMGVEQLWTRRQFAMHPNGIKWTDTTVGGEFPSNADLALTANWLRVYAERKQVPLAFLITNG
jgi:hypothetical protein